jgi:Transcriptional regulators containing a DNA-binding HTH domain and an aminotransferase domain (MocR family) and their eukaryotic orthologs
MGLSVVRHSAAPAPVVHQGSHLRCLRVSSPEARVPRGRRPFAVAGTLLVELDPAVPVPLYEQIYRGVRTAVQEGRLAPGMRIPSSRVLAGDLAVSRSTVLLALEQLAAEGYLASQARSGTRVAAQLPDPLLSTGDATPQPVGASPTAASRSVSPGGRSAAKFQEGSPRLGAAPRPFRPGTPALDQFPTELWSRLAIRRYRRLSFALLDHADPRGYAPLREAIAAHVQSARGVRCTADQVLITSGAQQALSLVAQVLVSAGDQVWMEDPGYLNVRGALGLTGAEIVSVPVDEDGINVREGRRRAPHARLAYVTPSHQFPLGITMSASRRAELLQWAAEASAWIVEDDYDNECRFSGHPLPALQGMDRDRRVLYVGTFSKTVFPSLRIGYLIAPRDLMDTLVNARTLADGRPASVDQAILADFITEGHFTRHVRRMRALYADRQQRLVALAGAELSGLLSVAASPSGLHLLGWLPRGVSDRVVSDALAARGVEAPPLSRFFASGTSDRGALLLGYGALDEAAMRDGVRTIREVVGSLVTDSFGHRDAPKPSLHVVPQQRKKVAAGVAAPA